MIKRGWKFFLKDATFLYLFLIVVLSTFVRLYKLDFKSFWLDELYTAVPTNPNNPVGFIVNYCKSDQPPLFFLLLHYWFKLFVYNSFYGRLLAAVIGVLGVLAMYVLGKEIKNKEVGIFASFLTSINYFHIYYSQECRFYSLLFLMTVISFIFFLRSIKHRSPGNCILYVISTIGLLYTHYFGILVFVIQNFIFLVYALMYKEKIKMVFLGFSLAAVIGAAFLPWVPVIINDSQISSYWVEKPKFYFPAVYYYLYFGKDVLTALMLLGLSFVYLWHFTRRLKETSRFDLFICVMVISWIVLSYLIPYVQSIVLAPALIPRYTLITLPAIFVLVSLGWTRIKNRRMKYGMIAVLLVAALVNLFLVTKHYTTIDKAQMREAAEVVLTKRKPGTKVYSNLEWWYNFYFYSANPPVKVIGKYSVDDPADLPPFIEEIENEKEFWVLSGEGMNGLNTAQQRYTDQYYRIKESYYFYATSAILYERKE